MKSKHSSSKQSLLNEVHKFFDRDLRRVLRFLALVVPKVLVLLVDLLPLDLLGSFAHFNQAVHLTIHLTQLVAVHHRLVHILNVSPLLLVAHSERNKDVLLSRLGVDRAVLGLAQRHQAVVRAVESLVPGLLSAELVVDVGVYLQLVAVEHVLYASSIHELLLEWGKHLGCAR